MHVFVNRKFPCVAGSVLEDSCWGDVSIYTVVQGPVTLKEHLTGW